MQQHVRNVHHLPNTNILIDFWKPSEKRRNSIRFMTVFRLTDEQLRNIKANDYKIYTSCLNRDLLESHKVPAERIVAIKPHHSINVSDEIEGYFFKVSVIDSNYCIGSCMFLFQGPFGTILYTGFFRPAKACYPLYNPVLEPLIQDRLIDDVYIDNSYAAEHCQFPSRAEVIQQTINLIKEHPDYKIIISGKKFGKEEILRDIAVSVNETIGISEEKYAILSPIITHLRNFSVDRERCRIILEDELFTLKQCKEKLAAEGTSIIILLTASYICEEKRTGTPAPRLSNMYILPYSSHASHGELMNFLYHLKARSIKPIILDESENTIIPQKMLDLCYSDEDSVPLRDSDFYFDSHTDPDLDTLSRVANSSRLDGDNSSNLNNATLKQRDNSSVQIPASDNNRSESTRIDVENVTAENSSILRGENDSSLGISPPDNKCKESPHIDPGEFSSENSDVFYETQTLAFQVYLEEQEEEILVQGSDFLETRDPLSMSHLSDVSVINNSLPIDSNEPDIPSPTKSVSTGVDNGRTCNLTRLENDIQNEIFPQSNTSDLNRLLSSNEMKKNCRKRCHTPDPEVISPQKRTKSAKNPLETECNDNNELNDQSENAPQNEVLSEERSSPDLVGSNELNVQSENAPQNEISGEERSSPDLVESNDLNVQSGNALHNKRLSEELSSPDLVGSNDSNAQSGNTLHNKVLSEERSSPDLVGSNDVNAQPEKTLHNEVLSEELSLSDLVGSDGLVGKHMKSVSVEPGPSRIEDQDDTESNISLALSDRSNLSNQERGNLRLNEFMSEEEKNINLALYHYYMKIHTDDEGQSLLDAWKDVDYYSFNESD